MCVFLVAHIAQPLHVETGHVGCRQRTASVLVSACVVVYRSGCGRYVIVVLLSLHKQVSYDVGNELDWFELFGWLNVFGWCCNSRGV